MKRVAIVGFAPSYVDAPFGDPSIDIWTMNYHHESVSRSDRIFEMHTWDVVSTEDHGSHVASLAASTVPVYMLEARPEVPRSIAFPIDHYKAIYTLPNADLPYFTNTASYMVAMAIEEGYEEIHTYGIDMAHDTEYGTYRPSCEFFLGVAFGKGITVIPHRTSDLLKTCYLYGYENGKRDWFREKLVARKADLEQKRNSYLEQVNSEAVQVQELTGALKYYGTSSSRETLSLVREQHLRVLEQAKAASSEFNGAMQNNDHILKVWAQ